MTDRGRLNVLEGCDDVGSSTLADPLPTQSTPYTVSNLRHIWQSEEIARRRGAIVDLPEGRAVEEFADPQVPDYSHTVAENNASFESARQTVADTRL